MQAKAVLIFFSTLHYPVYLYPVLTVPLSGGKPPQTYALHGPFLN